MFTIETIISIADTSGQIEIDQYMVTCVINICHIVALCGLTPVVVDNAKKSELTRIRIRKGLND